MKIKTEHDILYREYAQQLVELTEWEKRHKPQLSKREIAELQRLKTSAANNPPMPVTHKQSSKPKQSRNDNEIEVGEVYWLVFRGGIVQGKVLSKTPRYVQLRGNARRTQWTYSVQDIRTNELYKVTSRAFPKG